MAELVLIAKEEFDFLKKEITEIKQMLKGSVKPEPEQSISHKTAAAFLNIHRDTLTDRVNDGTYPRSIVHMNGRKREYYKSELSQLLNKKVK
jgi:hypothetical protein